jgi:aromatic ring-opening dioxygenase catalytic subunit (LigB family)
MKQVFSILIIGLTVVLASCGGNSELKKDTAKIADAMCKGIEIMNKLQSVNPGDSSAVHQLQARQKLNETEMNKLYEEFQKKYKDKINDKQFTDDFSKELRKAMLNCQYLSKEDRETFEKEINK